MKTPEENQCGMECIRTNVERSCVKPEKGQCPRCKQLVDDSLAYIQQLESRLAQAERYAKEMADNLDCSACAWCEYFDSDYANEACKECRTYNEGFKLRSVCRENTKEET